MSASRIRLAAGGLLAAVGLMGASAVHAQEPFLGEIRTFGYNFWVGMFAPSKTPKDTINRLYQETAKALHSSEVREKMARLGAEPMEYAPEAFNAYIRDEIASNAALVKAAGIKIE